jgi:hypothetical protein
MRNFKYFDEIDNNYLHIFNIQQIIYFKLIKFNLKYISNSRIDGFPIFKNLNNIKFKSIYDFQNILNNSLNFDDIKIFIYNEYKKYNIDYLIYRREIYFEKIQEIDDELEIDNELLNISYNNYQLIKIKIY